ncbi:MAG TPA: hypothetical protein VFL47_00245 [Flavisolibacter sp.]|nr:hypothetical protein [Flavisolibacter sp.]
MYSYKRFKNLKNGKQIDQLSEHGVPLDLSYQQENTEVVLFAYNDFYVELVVIKYTDEILALQCFKSLKKLKPYLHQVDISEIMPLLHCSR